MTGNGVAILKLVLLIVVEPGDEEHIWGCSGNVGKALEHKLFGVHVEFLHQCCATVGTCMGPNRCYNGTPSIIKTTHSSFLILAVDGQVLPVPIVPVCIAVVGAIIPNCAACKLDLPRNRYKL